MSRQSIRPSRLLTLALAGVCIVLVLVLGGQRWLAGDEPDADVIQVSPTGAGVPSSLETRRFELPSRGEYAEIAARPLFNEDRRPEEDGGPAGGEDEAIAAEEEAPAEPPPVSLTGVIITPEQRIAMMRNTESREFVTLKEGEPLEGWTLDEVSRRRVVFATGDDRQVVELEVYTGSLGGGRRRGRNGGNGDQPGQERSNQPLSATEQIRERIQRERERRQQLIEEARKRQQNADSDQ